MGERGGLNLYIFVLNNPSGLYDILGREVPPDDEPWWPPPDDIDLTPIKEALKIWVETRILDYVNLIGKRVKEIPQMLSHPFGPIGYELENYYTIGVALVMLYRLEGKEGVISSLAPDAYTVYVHGINDDEGGTAAIRLML